ncbi:hypothetical protein DFS34DRAFT_604479 [Phlyctochytrium arcticum]|nr:hypothetical protein DFS34DRAFT_604479 [Phlyctochytrium arcticum]
MAGGFKIPIGVYPLVAVMGVATVGVGWTCYKRSFGPDVIWARAKNPQPWNTVGENETTKFYDPSGKFASWGRWNKERGERDVSEGHGAVRN